MSTQRIHADAATSRLAEQIKAANDALWVKARQDREAEASRIAAIAEAAKTPPPKPVVKAQPRPRPRPVKATVKRTTPPTPATVPVVPEGGVVLSEREWVAVARMIETHPWVTQAEAEERAKREGRVTL